jgi:hypothetical protein
LLTLFWPILTRATTRPPTINNQQANSDSDSDSSDEDMNDGEQEAGEDAEAEEEKITEQNFDAATKILHDVRLTAHFQVSISIFSIVFVERML